MEHKNLDKNEDKVNFTFDKENDKVIITENDKKRETNVVGGFQEALKIGGEESKNEIKQFATDNDMLENFKEAESKNFTEEIKEMRAENYNEKNEETKIILIDKETGTERELGATEAMSEALKTATDEEKEKMSTWAKENNLEQEFNAAQAINNAVKSFAYNISDNIIENNKNSENAFDRGVGEFLENLDSKNDKGGAER